MVAASFVIGVLAALMLVAAPIIPLQEPRIVGAMLCGFAVGWATLAVLSARLTDQPQRWAMAPALFMGAGGLLLLAFGPAAKGVLAWVWPPALVALVLWMALRTRRHLPRRRSRWPAYAVLGMFALAAIGGAWQTVGAAVDARANPMPGQLVDVGGHRLHLSCTGAGSPTVVVEPGGGEMSSNWGWITPAVARSTRVCVYDRAGRGWSDPSEVPQDGAAIAADLHTLLHRGNVPGPYVLAGHSFGGLYVLAFAAQHPDEVAGMVLVDSTAPAAPARGAATLAESSYDPLARLSALMSTVAEVGIARLYAQVDAGTLPPRASSEVRASTASAENLRSVIDEYMQAGRSVEQAGALTDFGGKPLVVLTAGSGSAPDWPAKQDRLAALSTNTSHRVIAGAKHEDLVADEADAATTTRAILDTVSAVRTGTPLPR